MGKLKQLEIKSVPVDKMKQPEPKCEDPVLVQRHVKKEIFEVYKCPVGELKPTYKDWVLVVINLHGQRTTVIDSMGYRGCSGSIS